MQRRKKSYIMKMLVISPEISLIENLIENKYLNGGFYMQIILDAFGETNSVKNWLETVRVSEPTVYKRFNYDLDFLELFGDQVRKGGCPLPDTIKKLKGTDGIWQLRVDDYRIFYFYFDNDTIVMTNVFRKKTNKTPQKEIKKAEKLKSTFRQ